MKCFALDEIQYYSARSVWPVRNKGDPPREVQRIQEEPAKPITQRARSESSYSGEQRSIEE